MTKTFIKPAPSLKKKSAKGNHYSRPFNWTNTNTLCQNVLSIAWISNESLRSTLYLMIAMNNCKVWTGVKNVSVIRWIPCTITHFGKQAQHYQSDINTLERDFKSPLMGISLSSINNMYVHCFQCKLGLVHGIACVSLHSCTYKCICITNLCHILYAKSSTISNYSHKTQ